MRLLPSRRRVSGWPNSGQSESGLTGGAGGALQSFGTVRGATAAGGSAEVCLAPESLTSYLFLKPRAVRNFKYVNELG